MYFRQEPLFDKDESAFFIWTGWTFVMICSSVLGVIVVLFYYFLMGQRDLSSFLEFLWFLCDFYVVFNNLLGFFNLVFCIVRCFFSVCQVKYCYTLLMIYF